MPTRRQFVSQTGLTAAALAVEKAGVPFVTDATAAPAGKSLRVLILGGTGFIGPHFVRAALQRGHKVSVFNRGKGHADLPPGVEQLIGDRNNDLRSIENRTWDSVIDLATYGPIWVRSLGEALKQRAKHYTFISTIDVYKHRSNNPSGTDEQSETVDYELHLDPYSHSVEELNLAAVEQFCSKDALTEACINNHALYGPLKVLCEKEAERQFPGRALIVRPGYMVGAGDPQARFTYWVARLARGGDVLAPGDPLQPVQFIDVRDIAEWAITMAERAETGIYNALGPGNSISICEVLGGIRSIFGIPTKLTWVSIPWGTGQDIVDPDTAEWLIWKFPGDEACKSHKAVAKGLSYRPLSVTANDVLEWYKSQPLEKQSAVVTGHKVDDLAALKAHQVLTSWTDITQREKEILARWRVHESRL